MHQGKLVFAQVMAHLPLSTFRRCVARYDGEHKVKSFSCLDQFYAMAFAQLTFRESLRDIEACLATQGQRLYHLGFRSPVARNTLANANAVRPWQIYADLAQHLIGIARPLYANEPIGLDLKETVYAFDATTIDLCLSVYPWAPFRSTKAAIKLHTLLDVRGSIPSFIHISDGKTHEVNVLDALTPEPGAFYLLDRGYMDFARRRPKQSRHNCETKVVTPPLMTTAGQPKPSNGAGFQGLRSKGVTSHPAPSQRSKVVTAFLTV